MAIPIVDGLEIVDVEHQERDGRALPPVTASANAAAPKATAAMTRRQSSGGKVNMASTLIVQATLTTAFAILQEAVLSFLGLGAQPPAPSWGQDISYNQRYITNLMWWGSVGPGASIFLAVFAFNFLGDALRDWLDPQFRRRA